LTNRVLVGGTVLELTPRVVARIFQEHQAYWDDPVRVKEMERLSKAYRTRFWDDPENAGKLTVQTSDAYSYIEGYQASLYSKNPAAVLRPGIRAQGDYEKAQSAGNWWLKEFARAVLERTSRRALIYPFAGVKLYPVDTDGDVFRRVRVMSLFPWDMLLDTEADDWDCQRWVGHTYWLSVGEAAERFGPKDYVPAAKVGYFDAGELDRREDPTTDDRIERKLWGYIRVVELYCYGRRYFWSPHYQQGSRFIQKPDAVPFVGYDDAPVVPIVALFYNEDPDRPLVGYSALFRIYDQVFEKNIVRTYKARGVRKTGRQHIWRKGVLDDEQRAQLETGEDGLNIEVDTDDVRAVCAPVPHEQMHAEVDVYAQQVQHDLDKGSVLAPFTRGEATKATATEINALAAYTSSEVGRMARERDGFIERLIQTWLPMQALYLSEAAENVSIDGQSVNIRAADLLGDFEVYAEDGARTPLSDAARKNETMALLPVLAGLGVSREALLKHLVASFDLPESFEQEAQPAPVPTPKVAAVGEPEGALPFRSAAPPPGPNLGGAGPRV
jgi:hypothetical protein